MANPRKFSEKIALHTQKQAEETAAFEAILRDVSAATRGHMQQKQNQQLHIQQNIMQQYRGGSLPNVNQMVNANSGLDLQTLQHMEGLRGGPQARVDRMHPRDRGRQQIGPLRSRPFQMEKSRADCSPYGSGAYLSPPPDTSWRRLFRHLNGVSHLSRTNSDSAIHSSSALGRSSGDGTSPNTPPMHRRIHEVVGENSGLSAGPFPWDPKKLQQRPKSCEVPNINIYPSGEPDSQMHIPVASNTGSLPDLTILQFPSPLTTPIDIEDQNYNNNSTNLSPTGAHHVNMGPPQHHNGSPAQSPGSQRRRINASGPSPLVLTGNGNQSMRVPVSPPVPNIDPTTLQMDPRIRQQYMLFMQQQQQRHRGQGPGHMSPTQSSQNQVGLAESPRVPPPHLGPVPKVCVTSHENDPPEPSLTQYRNNISESGCQSPTSPHSQPSYSPSQSPGLPPNSWNNSVFELDPYHVQQQQTNALQQQFEHFNMEVLNRQVTRSDNYDLSSMHQASSVCNDVSKAGVCITSTSSNSLPYSQASSLVMSPDYSQQQYYIDVTCQSPTVNNTLSSSIANNKIPDIVLSGLSSMGEGSFDADLFSGVSDEALKDGLVPLDLDGLQMLTDPNMVADADTENSFRLDQL